MSTTEQKAERIIAEARVEAARIIAEAHADADALRAKTQAWIDSVAEQVEHDRLEILAEARAEVGGGGSSESGKPEGAWQRFGRT